MRPDRHVTPIRRLALPALGVVALLAAAGPGCSLEGKARSDFSREEHCPANRITVKERTDLTATNLGSPGRGATLDVPPPEVARDPERLVVWHKERSRTQARRSEYDSRFVIFEAEGCGQRAIYSCSKKVSSCSRQLR